jgi:hypothetical protein
MATPAFPGKTCFFSLEKSRSHAISPPGSRFDRAGNPHFFDAFRAHWTVALRFVGGSSLLVVEPAPNWYGPMSHAPLAGRAFGVPLHTDCTTVLTVC